MGEAFITRRGGGNASIKRLIVNDDSIVPTGTYANATYYNVEYGVKVGYCANGDIIVSMKGGTTTAYENIVFELYPEIDGVTLLTTTPSSYGTANGAGGLYCCVIQGLTVKCTMDVTYYSRDGDDDYTKFRIALTPV